MWMFENRALRNIFGYKKKLVTGEWRRLQNEELHDLFCSSVFFGSTVLQWAMTSSFTRFLDHIQRRTTVGRTPLDK